jgi:hypothetical protein
MRTRLVNVLVGTLFTACGFVGLAILNTMGAL